MAQRVRNSCSEEKLHDKQCFCLGGFLSLSDEKRYILTKGSLSQLILETKQKRAFTDAHLCRYITFPCTVGFLGQSLQEVVTVNVLYERSSTFSFFCSWCIFLFHLFLVRCIFLQNPHMCVPHLRPLSIWTNRTSFPDSFIQKISLWWGKSLDDEKDFDNSKAGQGLPFVWSFSMKSSH